MASNTTYSNLSDEELIRRYRDGGDNLWLGYLLNRYSLLLLGVAIKYLKERDLAEDAVQQVFLKALTHFPKAEINNFKGWLYILMRNHCFQELRNRTHNLPDETLTQVVSDDDEELHQKIVEEYTLAQMQEAINELNAEQRATITLFYLQKQTYEQICASTGYNFMQVKSYIQNGKRNLKLILLKKLNQVQ